MKDNCGESYRFKTLSRCAKSVPLSLITYNYMGLIRSLVDSLKSALSKMPTNNLAIHLQIEIVLQKEKGAKHICDVTLVKKQDL